MLPTIQLGPASIPTAALILLASIWIGTTLTEKRAHWHGLNSNSIDNLILFILIGFVIGGRLVYAAIHLDTVLASPLDLFSLDRALFDLSGGLGTSLLVGLIHGTRKRLPFWSTVDSLTPFFATLMVALGAAHLANGTAFGKETALPWGIEYRDVVRHPSQVYEIAGALFILNLIGLRKPYSIAGKQFSAFTAWTAGMHLFIEAFRGDSILFAEGIRSGQILAWIVLAVALFTLERLQSAEKLSET